MSEEPLEPVGPQPTPKAEEKTSAGPRPLRPASAFVRPYAHGEAVAPSLPEPLPARMSLTLEDAKSAIRTAGGNTIQIGFLASAYVRQQAELPGSTETVAARERLCELVAKRLKDYQLLARDGHFVLLEESATPTHAL